MVPSSLQDEPIARYGVSRKVPVSVLKCKTVPDTFHATPRSSPTHRVPSRETDVWGSFWVSHEGCQVLFRTSGRNMGLPLRRCSGLGPHLAKTLEPRGFSRVAAGLSSDDGDYRLPLLSALGSPTFYSSARESWGLRSSHCRAKETSSRLVSRT